MVYQVVANETKVVVQREEEEAAKKAAETQAIADDAQRDLDEALPALVRGCLLWITDMVLPSRGIVRLSKISFFSQEAALASLKSLNKTDVVEVWDKPNNLSDDFGWLNQ